VYLPVVDLTRDEWPDVSVIIGLELGKVERNRLNFWVVGSHDSVI
jgi:hypothetical protein